MDAIKERTLNELLVESRHFFIEALRIFLGGMLFLKGYYFVENLSVIYGLIEANIGISPFILSHYVVAAHLVGGVMLIFGVLTRIAAAVQIPILAGAVLFVHSREIILGAGSDFQYALLVLVLLIVFFFYGGGKLSVDHHVIRKEEK